MSAAEVLSAQTSYGYVVEKDAGFVWPQAASPVHRSIGDRVHFGEHFYTGDAEIASSFGYTPENMNVFYLWAKQETGTLPFYQCAIVRQQVHQHFYTTDPQCELWGSPAREYPLGYIATSARPGTAMLYRLRREDHLYTISAAEVQSAQALFGYVLENPPGYVRLSP